MNTGGKQAPTGPDRVRIPVAVSPESLIETEVPPDAGRRLGDISRQRRRHGTGRLFVKHHGWYGSWRTADGRRVTRKVGPDTLAEPEAEALLAQMMATGARYRKRARRPRYDANGGVYFIVGADKVKIGRTERTPVADRLERLRRFSPVALTLHRFVACPFPDAAEKALHARFAGRRSHGEWFEASVLAEVDGMSDENVGAGNLDRVVSEPSARALTSDNMNRPGDRANGPGTRHRGLDPHAHV